MNKIDMDKLNNKLRIVLGKGAFNALNNQVPISEIVKMASIECFIYDLENIDEIKRAMQNLHEKGVIGIYNNIPV